MQNQKMIGVAVLVCAVVSAATFYAGTQYQASKQTSPNGFAQLGGTTQNGRIGNRTFGNGMSNGSTRMGFRPVNGEILSVDDKSIVVKSQDGSSKIILMSDKTSINKAEKAAVTDLKVGETVAVFGTQNTDGSVSAQSIQLDPTMLRGGVQGTPPPQPDSKN